jgi:hypothetical protein
VHVVTGDYLAELTMLILWKARRKTPKKATPAPSLTQLEQVLGTVLDRGSGSSRMRAASTRRGS